MRHFDVYRLNSYQKVKRIWFIFEKQHVYFFGIELRNF